jgi:hypothetical protein
MDANENEIDRGRAAARAWLAYLWDVTKPDFRQIRELEQLYDQSAAVLLLPEGTQPPVA